MPQVLGLDIALKSAVILLYIVVLMECDCVSSKKPIAQNIQGNELWFHVAYGFCLVAAQWETSKSDQSVYGLRICTICNS